MKRASEFYGTPAFLSCLGLMATSGGLFFVASTMGKETTGYLLFLVGGIGGMVSSLWLWNVSSVRLEEAIHASEIREASHEMRLAFGDLDSVKAEQKKNRKAIEENLVEFQKIFQEEASELIRIRGQIERQVEKQGQEVAQSQEALRQMRQEGVRKDAKIKAGQDAFLGVFETFERTLSQPSLPDEARKATERLLRVVESFAKGIGVYAHRPARGEAFVPSLHRLAEEKTTDVCPAGSIGGCEEWGFVVGEVVVKPAKVWIAKAPERRPTEEQPPPEERRTDEVQREKEKASEEEESFEEKKASKEESVGQANKEEMKETDAV